MKLKKIVQNAYFGIKRPQLEINHIFKPAIICTQADEFDEIIQANPKTPKPHKREI